MTKSQGISQLISMGINDFEIAATKNDLIGLNKEIMYWQEWLKQHHN
mgnify:CR=1 FL=1